MRCTSFSKDEAGGVALAFGLIAFPLFFAVGAAYDYSRATLLKTKLQAATDAAALAVANKIAKDDDQKLKAYAQQLIAQQTGDPSAKITRFNVTNSKTKVFIETTATSPNAFMTLAGVKETPVTADAATAVDNTYYEIALVLDNSGSMGASAGGSSKIQALRDAANKLVDTMLTGPASKRTKISIVPFTLTVNVGPENANANWMDRNGESPIHWQNFDHAASSWKPKSRFEVYDELNIFWGGCVESRPGDWGVNDDAPTSSDPSSLFVPMLAPDEPGDKGAIKYDSPPYYLNSYIADNPASECAAQQTQPTDYAAAQKKLCKYRNKPSYDISLGRGPNLSCNAKPIVRLTSDLTTLHTSINAMVADGNTNIFEGFAWGWRTLSPNKPFSDGDPYSRSDLKKVIILMTDGMNVWGGINNHNGSAYSPFGFYSNARLGPAPTGGPEARAQIDAKTLAACTNAKAKKIDVYTVGFSVAGAPIDAAGLDLLKKCATSSDMAYVANDSAQFLAAFDDIAQRIGQPRITQ